MTQSRHIHFRNLDVLRFVAAFYVLISHTYDYMTDQYVFSFPHNKSLFATSVNQFLRNGGFGVDIFFLISGFLITSLLLHEKTTGGIGIRNFYVRRVLRIWPLYYLIIGLAYLFAHHYTGEPLYRKDIYPHLFFVSNFTMIGANSWCAGKLFILWSICIEEHFYLIIPVLLIMTPLKKLPWVLSGIIAISIASRAWLFHHYPYPWFPIYLHTFSRFDTLAIGCMMGYFHYCGFTLPSRSYIRLSLFIFLVAALMLFSCFYFDTFYRAVIFKYVFTLPGAFLFYDLITNILPSLNNRAIRLLNQLGKYSYGVYMYQVFLIVVADRWATDYFSKSKVAFAAISILLTFLASIISYEIFEKHFLKLKKRFEKEKTATLATAIS
jgi:peptidoglycan/LPS O-acetylase OafA/YrhL